MTDFEKMAMIVELAARRNGDAINKSVWVGEKERLFLSNAFLAFADEIAILVKEHAKAVQQSATV